MPKTAPRAPIIALVYPSGEDAQALLRRIAEVAGAEGLRVSGLLQRDVPRAGRAKCDMMLEDLASGRVMAISVDRGAQAGGCRLDVGLLAEATGMALRSLAERPDLVIANKFGKVEAEGGGLRDLVAAALEADARVLVAVPERNLDAWRDFASDLTFEVDASAADPVAATCAALGIRSEALERA